MSDVLKILVVLVIFLVLLRRKIFLGTVMFVGSLCLAVLYRTPPLDFLVGLWSAILSPVSLEMAGTIVLTMILENVLRKTETLKIMVMSLSRILSDYRLVMAAMPAVIGLLPSPGGAVFSAPMVGEAAAVSEVSPERKAFINYWFRHIWEYVSPLYPGVILAAGIAGISCRELAILNAPFAISVVVWGWLLCFTGIKKSSRTDRLLPAASGKALISFCRAFSPIMLILILVVIAGFSPVLSLSGVILALLLLHRYSPSRVWVTLRESVSLRMLLMVAAILVFQETLRSTGSLNGISAFLTASGLPIILIVVALPLMAGLMTGLTIAYVGICFPLLLPLMGHDPHFPGLLALAFGSGFAGVMLSPLHLCLVLTKEYFNAEFSTVYRLLLFPSFLVLAAAAIPFIFMS